VISVSVHAQLSTPEGTSISALTMSVRLRGTITDESAVDMTSIHPGTCGAK
jgi:hypothetical protein